MTDNPSSSPAVGVSVVIPVFNEEANLPDLVRRCVAACDRMATPYEIVLVDDGSRDRSPELIEEAATQHPGRVRGVLLNRNYGQHAAVTAGFAHARGAIIVTLDADLQNPPEEIPRLVEKAAEGYDVVGSVRVPRQDSSFRRISSSLINWSVRCATGVQMHDYGCMLRAYRRPVVETMLSCRERSTFIPILANMFAHRTTEIEVSHAARPAGESKYSVLKLINLQFDLLTSMTTIPLRLLSIIGFLMSAGGVAFATFLLLARLFFGADWAVQGVFTLFAILFVFLGVQLIGMGLLGEYIGRIYSDVRQRPRYVVSRIIGDNGGSTP